MDLVVNLTLRKGTMDMKKIRLNLQRFGEGGGDGAAASTGDVGIAGETQTSPVAVGKRGRKGNVLANVQYGKVAEDVADQVQSEEVQEPEQEVGKDDNSQEELVDKQKLFEEMIKGEYKEEFDARTQRILNKRFGEVKQLQERQESLSPILDTLARKYGVDAQDIEALSKAIEEDASFYEEEALKKGMTVDQLKEIRRLERENAKLSQAREEAERRQNADNIYKKWMQESEIAKQTYPNFDFKAETQNKNFNDLLKNGIDVKTAYEVVHKDEIIGGAMQYTAQQIRQKTVDNIKARGSRPVENGVSSQAAVVAKTDVKKLTRADREEIARRVARGEKIAF